MYNDTCFILNYAPHYRKTIFEKLSKELKCDIYCGDKIRVAIKKIDFNTIDFSIKELKTIWFLNKIAWMKGQLSLLFDKKYKTYVLTGQPFFLSDMIFVLLCFFTSKKVMIWNHGPRGKENAVKRLYYKIFFLLIDGAFIYSEWSKKILVHKYGVNQERLNVIYNSLDYNSHLKIRLKALDNNYYSDGKFFKDTSLPTIVFIGRLTTVKRIDLLIDTIKTLNQEGYFLNLMIIGDGIAKKELIDRAEEIKDFVYFFGGSYDELENAKLLANADLCVSPGNVGLTAIHSMSFGTPVCTHDDFTNQMPEVGAIEENKTGTYYSLKENNLTEVIKRWFKSDFDRDLIRKNCYEKIDNHFNPNFQISVFKNGLEKQKI